MSITTNFSKKSKKESENSQNFNFLDIYVLFFIFLKLHRCNKIVVNKSFSHFIFLPDKKSEFLSVIFPLQIKRKRTQDRTLRFFSFCQLLFYTHRRFMFCFIFTILYSYVQPKDVLLFLFKNDNIFPIHHIHFVHLVASLQHMVSN